MTPLQALATRVKGSRLWRRGGQERLYVRVGSGRNRNAVTVVFKMAGERIVMEIAPYDEMTASSFDAYMQIRSRAQKQLSSLLIEDEQPAVYSLDEQFIDDVSPVVKVALTRLQDEAVRFMCHRKVGSLNAPIGSGKTRIMAVVAASRHAAGQIDKAVVYCPTGIIDQYAAEWAKASECPIHVYGLESVSQSYRIFDESSSYIDARTMLVVDESHMIKTPTANRTERLHSIASRASYRYIVTGTPITDGVQNVWAQYHVLSPRIIGVESWQKFADEYLVYGGPTGNDIIAHRQLPRLSSLLSPYTYTSSEEHERTITGPFYISVSSDVRQKYDEIKNDFLMRIVRGEPRPNEVYKFLLDLHLCAMGVKQSRYKKVVSLAGAEQAVVFTPYVDDAKAFREFVGPSKCGIIIGEERPNRRGHITDFVSGRKQFIVSTLASGSTGLDGLQVARRLIFMAHSWKYSERQQAIGRIARLGQESHAVVSDVVVNIGICDQIMKNLARKRGLIDEVRDVMGSVERLRQYAEAL